MDQDIELCRYLIKSARAMQQECEALLDNSSNITKSCEEILKQCRYNFERISNLRKVSKSLLDLASAILEADIKPLPSKQETLLPALVDKDNYLSQTIEAAAKCLNEIHIVGMSAKTVLTWPIKEAPEALQRASMLLSNQPVDIAAIEWVSVVPPDGDSKWTFEASPFKTGYGVRFSSGHEVIYGLS